MTGRSRQVARAMLRRHARSFWWAAWLLPSGYRRDAAALYAWCRRCDDAVDHAPDAATAAAAIASLRAELDHVFGAGVVTDPVLAGFQDVVRRRGLPRGPADQLLHGMEMDLGPVRYQTFAELLVYCHRVAGTVGLLMARLMGVTDDATLARAAHLGIAMQLTNICRDVVEDQGRDRVYLPAAWLGAAAPASATRDTVAALLRQADHFYRSGDRGLNALPITCAAAIRAARLIYAEIGAVIAGRGFDVQRGRAVVSPGRKAWLVLRALGGTALARLRSGEAT